MVNERWFDILVREFRTLEAHKGMHQVRALCDFGRGTVWFRDGRLLDAEMGLFGGADAVFRLLGAKAGELDVVSGAMPRSRTIYLTVDELLVQHARRVSQGRDFANRLPALDTVPAVNSSVFERLRSALDGSEQRLVGLVDQRRTLRDILDQSGVGQEAAFQQLAEYFAVGLLVPHATKLGAESRGRDTRPDPSAGLTPRVPTLMGAPEPARTHALVEYAEPNVVAATVLEPPKASLPASFAQTLQVEVPPGEPREKPPLVSVATPGLAVSDAAEESALAVPNTLRMPVPIPAPAAPRVLRRVTQAGPFTATMPLGSAVREHDAEREPLAVRRPEAVAAADSVVSTARGLALAGAPLELSRSSAVTLVAPKTEAVSPLTPEGHAFQATLPGGLVASSPVPPRPAEAPAPTHARRPGATTTPVAPRRVIGRYEVLAELAGDPAKPRYLARERTKRPSSTLFSLRVLPAGQGADAADLARAVAELTAVRHPNLVSFVDAGTDKEQLYVAYDYIEGSTLSRLLEKATTRPPRLLVSILLDALMGLHAIHTASNESGAPMALGHGYLSPDNILVSVNGTARIQNLVHPLLGDGSALAEGRGPARALAYRAPERLQGEPLDRRADVFSIAVILWNTLTSENLFLGGTDQETIKNVLEKEIPAPSTRGVRPPACFDATCMKALDRDPDRRFQWAEEMLTHLGRIALQQGLLASKREVAEWVLQTVGAEIQRERQAIDGLREAGIGNRESPLPSVAGRNSSYDLRADLKKASAGQRRNARSWAVGIGLSLATAMTLGALTVAARKFGFRFGLSPTSSSESISAALAEQNAALGARPLAERAADVDGGRAHDLGTALDPAPSASPAPNASGAAPASIGSAAERKAPARVVAARPRRAAPFRRPPSGKAKQGDAKAPEEQSTREQPSSTDQDPSTDGPGTGPSPGGEQATGAELPNADAPPAEGGGTATEAPVDLKPDVDPRLGTRE